MKITERNFLAFTTQMQNKIEYEMLSQLICVCYYLNLVFQSKFQFGSTYVQSVAAYYSMAMKWLQINPGN